MNSLIEIFFDRARAMFPESISLKLALESVLNAIPTESAETLACDDIAARGLISLCASSPSLARLLAGDPASVVRLFQQNELIRTKNQAALEKELAARVNKAESLFDLRTNIRRYRHSAMARIAVRDICGLAGLEEVMGELSDLAQAALEQACNWCFNYLVQKHGFPLWMDANIEGTGFAVIGMGKLGGHELNFCSDIDLIYLYKTPTGSNETTSGGSANPLHFHAFYTRFAEMVTDSLHRVTENGQAFRVDLDLRPGGKEGSIVHSLDSAEIYYTTHGETWHRLSLIKASFAAGDKEAAESFLKMIRPFVYRRHLDYGSLEEIRWLKRRVESSSGKESGLNVKMGRGGIRELEFLVQAIQIINGGRFPEIRESNTLKALSILSERGLIDDSTRVKLEESYRFLRRLENRIQMSQMLQTHSLPDDDDSLDKLSRGLGYTSAQGLIQDLRSHGEIVHDHFSRLMKEKEVMEIDRNLAEKILFGDMDKEEVTEALNLMGFHNFPAALEAIKSLKDILNTSLLPKRSQKLLKELAPSMLDHAVSAPDPDMALLNLERWFQRVGRRWGVSSLLTENPSVIGPLTRLFGSSNFLSRMFIDHPQLTDRMLLYDKIGVLKSRKDMEQNLSSQLREEESQEEKLAVMRRYQNEEILFTGIQYVFGEISEEEASMQLTSLADVCINRAFSMAVEKMNGRDRFPGEEIPPFVVMGLGGLGGMELNFNSDLDLLFIFEIPAENIPIDGAATREYFVRLSQRFLSLLSVPMVNGLGYRVDMRLRPSGTVGPLAVSLESFRHYYRNEARLWERQALIRARPVAGHVELGNRIMNDINWLVYEKPLAPDTAKQILQMRRRIEIEIARETDDHYNIKTGCGGLVDIEFAVQYLQLKHGGIINRVREPNTLKAIKIFEDEGLVTETDINALKTGYKYLRRLETHLRLLHDFSTDDLRFDSEAIDRITRGLGYKAESEKNASEIMKEEYKKITKNVRETFKRIVI